MLKAYMQNLIHYWPTSKMHVNKAFNFISYASKTAGLWTTPTYPYCKLMATIVSQKATDVHHAEDY